MFTLYKSYRIQFIYLKRNEIRKDIFVYIVKHKFNFNRKKSNISVSLLE